jgi:hypothetical protein
MNYGELEERYGDQLKIDPNSCNHSGGLSINVGNFLEIDPGIYHPDSQEWYTGGKVNVRIGKGLEAEPDKFDSEGHRIEGNKIQLKLSESSKLKFDDNGSLMVTNVIESVVTLDIIDTYNTHFEYNPIPQTEGNADIIRSTITLNIGKGLKLSDGSGDSGIETYKALINGMTSCQLYEFGRGTSIGEREVGENLATLNESISKKIAYAESHYSTMVSEIAEMRKIIKDHPRDTSGKRSEYMTPQEVYNYVFTLIGNPRTQQMSLWVMNDYADEH